MWALRLAVINAFGDGPPAGFVYGCIKYRIWCDCVCVFVCAYCVHLVSECSACSSISTCLCSSMFPPPPFLWCIYFPFNFFFFFFSQLFFPFFLFFSVSTAELAPCIALMPPSALLSACTVKLHNVSAAVTPSAAPRLLTCARIITFSVSPLPAGRLKTVQVRPEPWCLYVLCRVLCSSVPSVVP